MPQSASTSKLNATLAKAQLKFAKLEKDTTGREGNLKFKYVQLPDVLNMARPILNELGIYLSQPIIKGEDGVLRLTTRVQLEEEFDQSDGIPLPAMSPGKELGKIITYARRIDLMPFLGIVGEADEDAPDLEKPAETGTALRTGKPTWKKSIDPEQPLAHIGSESISQGLRTNSAITNADIPGEMFETSTRPVEKLSSEAATVADEIGNFTPLTEHRNTQIQDRLKELVTGKTVDRRKLQNFLDTRHNNKRAFEVHANLWEETITKIEEAVKSGPDAIKALLKIEKA